MRRTAKLVLLLGVAVLALGTALRVEIGGRTGYERFRGLGGEEALLEGLAWVQDGLGSAASRAGQELQALAGEAWRSATAWLADDDPAPPTSDAPRPAASLNPSPDEGETPAAAPEAQTSPGARDRVRRLQRAADRVAAAATTGPSGDPAPPPAAKARTRVDARIGPEEKAALDAELSARVER